MQTFLPYADFTRSVRSLDNKRLGKQRVEAYQIRRALTGATKGWVNHPATRMWAGFLDALDEYYNACLIEWKRRGFVNNMPPQFPNFHDVPLPPWLGDDRLHASHRANLLRKDPIYYGQHGWTDDPSLPYFWPTQEPAYAPLHQA